MAPKVDGAGWSLANFHTEASGGKRVYSGWPQFGVFALKVRLIVLLDSLRTFKVLRHGYDVLAAWASRDDVARNWESVMVPADALSDDEAMAIALEGAGRCRRGSPRTDSTNKTDAGPCVPGSARRSSFLIDPRRPRTGVC